jgi:nicotinate-nucleotide pyrophosphorylase (carboxylating)
MQRSQDIQTILMQALQEDIGRGDMTSIMTIPETADATMQFRARQEMVLSGVHFVGMLAHIADERLNFTPQAGDGDALQTGAIIGEISGPARSILGVERVALNLLQHLSGIATLTASYAQAIAGSGARIVDTRKTLPGLRDLQKYAVRCGGGYNHRMGLDDGVLIKDNHIAIAGGITAAVAAAREATPLLTKIEVECDNIEQVREAIAAKADLLLLDNMSLDNLREAVALAKAANIATEASGNVTLASVAAIAATGVNVISVGKLTHSAPAVDIGLDAV